MLRFTASVALAAALIPSFALAEQVPSATAYTVNLKDYYTAVVFYVDSPDGFQIVTSVAAESGPAIRFTNHLLAGQSATLTYANGTPAGIRVTAQEGPREMLSTRIAKL